MNIMDRIKARLASKEKEYSEATELFKQCFEVLKQVGKGIPSFFTQQPDREHACLCKQNPNTGPWGYSRALITIEVTGKNSVRFIPAKGEPEILTSIRVFEELVVETVARELFYA